MTDAPHVVPNIKPITLDADDREALNGRLAEGVMGWVKTDDKYYQPPDSSVRMYCGEGRRPLAFVRRWLPATDHNHAFQVLAQIPYRARLLCLNNYWTCQLTSTDPDCPVHLRYLSAIADSAPLAISLAAEKTIINEK